MEDIKQRLWIEGYIPTIQSFQEVFEEGANGKTMKLIMEGEFSSSKVNRNKRRIPSNVLKENTSRLLNVIEERGGIVAENGHPVLDPKDPRSMQRAITASFDRAAGVIQHLEFHPTKEIIYGKAEILYETPHGQPIAALARRGLKVGISSRAVGSKGVMDASGVTIYPEDTRIITFDFVENESNYGSVLSLYEESYNSMIESYYKENNVKTKSLYDIFNEHLLK